MVIEAIETPHRFSIRAVMFHCWMFVCATSIVPFLLSNSKCKRWVAKPKPNEYLNLLLVRWASRIETCVVFTSYLQLFISFTITETVIVSLFCSLEWPDWNFLLVPPLEWNVKNEKAHIHLGLDKKRANLQHSQYYLMDFTIGIGIQYANSHSDALRCSNLYLF